MVDYGQNLFVGEKLVEFLDELLALEELGKAKGGMLARDLILANPREVIIA